MPHLSDKALGWNHWYHLTATAYGQWLRGDPRGWRERHHRQHVPGGYKSPPPPSKFNDALLAQSQRLMKHEAQFIDPESRPVIGELLLGTFEFQKVQVSVASVGGEHIHVLVKCPDDNPEIVIGRSKQFVWTKFHEGMPRPWSKLWAKRPYGKPIQDEDHFYNARGYILQHAEDGAWIFQANPLATSL